MALDILLLVGRVLITVALYTFIGVMFVYLVRDLQALEQDEAAPNALAFLRITQSDLSEITPEQRFALHPRTRIGRAATCDIVLADDFVSLEHARIRHSAGQWWLIEGNSRNGTTVNGVPVEEDVVLAPGDEIRIGRVTMTFELT
jgi:hypothetical protein